MKLERLEVTDFLNHRTTAVEFGAETVIAGPNNAGKSALKDALEVVLTGTARTTDLAGREVAGLVRAGAEKFTVAVRLTTRDGATLRVTRTNGPEVEQSLEVAEVTNGECRPWEGPIKTKEKALLDALGVSSSGIIRACLHAGRLPEMRPEEQHALLFDSLGLTFSLERIHELLEAAGCEVDDVKLLYAGRDASFLAAPLRTGYGPEVFDEAHKFAYEKRRQVKRDLGVLRDDVGAREREVDSLLRATPVLDTLPDEWLKENETTLAGLEASKDELLRLQGASDSRREEIERLRAEAERLENAVSDWEKLLAKRERLTDGGDFTKQLAVAQSEAAAAYSRLVEAETRLAALEAAVFAFASGSPLCPLSGHPCPLTDEEAEDLKRALKKERTEAKKAVTKAKHDHEDVSKTVAKYEAVSSEPSTESLETLRNRRTEAKRKLRMLEEKADDADPDGLAAVRARIRAGREKVDLVKGFQAKKLALEEKKKAAEEAAVVVERWERLVLALGPKGAKLRAVEGPLKDLIERLNARLASYAARYSLRLRTDEGFLVEVRTPGSGDHWLTLGGLSTSERLRVGVALQDALAHASGLGFLLIDSFDMLDEANGKALGAALVKWREEYETIVVLTTTTRRVRSVEDEFVGYWVENGTVEVVPPGGFTLNPRS
jgi:DNA repair exonuclease SbcCD ATPase subunit